MRPFPVLVLLSVIVAGCGSAPPKLGAIAPNFTVEDGFGQPTSLEQFKGKVVIVDFWATWCGPCRQTMPSIQNLYSKYRSKGLVVMGLTKEPRQVVSGFLASNPYTYPMYIDTNGAAGSLYVKDSIPVLYLIGKTGHVVTVETGAPLNVRKLTDLIDAELAK